MSEHSSTYDPRSPGPFRIRDDLAALYADRAAMAALHAVAAQLLGVTEDSIEAEQLVADAVGDLYIDAMERNAQYTTVKDQLIDDVKRRAEQERKNRRRHKSIHAFDDDAFPAADDDLAGDPDRDVAVLRTRLTEARQRLRPADVAGHQLLTLYELGVRRKRAVLAMGMTEGAYRRARRRVLKALAARDRTATAEQPASNNVYRCSDPNTGVTSVVRPAQRGTLRAPHAPQSITSSQEPDMSAPAR
jgi:hypothetical protein